jgi:hypothetical protein
MRHLYYVRIGCCNGAMLTPGFFPFFSITRCVKKINKCVTSTCIYHSPWLCGHSVGLVFDYDSRVVYSFLHTTKDLGDPGSSRGTLERVRVDLTVWIINI